MAPAAWIAASTEAFGEHPISRLYARIEHSERRAAKLDAWTRDPANDDSFEWDHHYREMRRERAAVIRRRKAIRRIDAAQGADVSSLRPIEGRSLWGK